MLFVKVHSLPVGDSASHMEEDSNWQNRFPAITYYTAILPRHVRLHLMNFITIQVALLTLNLFVHAFFIEC